MSQPSMLDYHLLRQKYVEAYERNYYCEQRIKAFEYLEKKYSLYVQAAAFSQAYIEKVQQLGEMKKTINYQKLKITQLNKRIQVFEMQAQQNNANCDYPLRYANETLFNTINELKQELEQERARCYTLAYFSSQSKLSNIEESVFRSQIQELRSEVADCEYLKQKCNNIYYEKDLMENRLKQLKKENLDLNYTILALKDVAQDKAKLEDYLNSASAKDAEILQLKVDLAKSEKMAQARTKDADDFKFQVQNARQINEALEQENENLKSQLFNLQLQNTELQQASGAARRSAELLKSQAELSQSQQMSQSQAEQDRQLQAELELKELRFLLDKAQFYNKQLSKDNESLAQRNEVLEQQMSTAREKISQNVEFATLYAYNYKLYVEVINLRYYASERQQAQPVRCTKCPEHLQQIEELQREIKTLKQEKADAQAQEQVIQTLENALQTTRAQIRKCVEQAEEQEQRIEYLKAQLKTLSDMPAQSEDCENCKRLIDKMDGIIKDFDAKETQYVTKTAELNAYYEEIAQENDYLRYQAYDGDAQAKISMLQLENDVLYEKYYYLYQTQQYHQNDDFQTVVHERDELKVQLDEALKIIEELQK